MKHYQLNLLTIALATAGFSAYSYADQQTVNQQQAEEKKIEVIQVSGIRRSLQLAQAIKQDSSSVVEAVSAEDIGKLPDMSIAESIARLPGLTAQRLDGRANVVSVRGLAPDFTTATLNGREQVTVGDNRGVEFDQYPSEMMSNVVVYKTPDAGVMAQAIGGTIDMQTVRPLSHGEQALVFNLRGERNDLGALNAGSTANGYRGSFSYIDQFADDTLGVAFGYARMTSPNQEERWQAWGYGDAAGGSKVVGGAKPYVRSSELTRDGWLGIIELKPNDKSHTVFDAYYSKFEDEQQLRGIELPLSFGGATLINPVVENGLVTSGTFTNAKTLVRNDVNLRNADTIALGVNHKYQISEAWSLMADLSYSKAERDDFNLESYAATARGDDNGAKDTLGFNFAPGGIVTFKPTLDYSDPNLIKLGAARSWANGVTLPSDSQDGFVNTPDIEDELQAIRLSAKRVFAEGSISGVEIGANYSEREKSKVDTGNYLTLKNYPVSAPVPAQFLMAPTSLEFIGMGNMLSYDSMALYHSGAYREVSESLTKATRYNNTWSVNEKVTTFFVKGDVESAVAGLPMKGNVGLQAVHTDQQATGFASTTGSNQLVTATPVAGGDKYWELLPSVNLGFDVAEDQVVRIAAARTLARGRMDKMNASTGFSYDPANQASTDINRSPWSAQGANPELRPWMARQYDLSYENYFSNSGYFSASVFYKDLENYVFEQNALFDFTGYAFTGAAPALYQGYTKTPVNGNGGYINGIELSLSLTGQMITPALEGFGMLLSGSYTNSKVKETASSVPMSLPGLSEKVANATLYYEMNGWQVRTSARYRSEFLGEVSGESLTRVYDMVLGETVVDAQIGYDFSQSDFDELEGLSVLFQVSNLTNEPFVTYRDGDTRKIRDFQNYGRNFMFGISYKL